MNALNLPVFSETEVTDLLHSLASQQPYFVQVGAMDGVSFDPFYPFISHFRWPGLLVEPMPQQFAALQKNYADHPGLSFANSAVTDYEGTISMRYIDPAFVADGRLPSEVLGMSTISTNPTHFLPQHIKPEFKLALQDAERKIDVPCTTLPKLLQQYNVQKIDLFVCDTEGADWLILQQLDLSQYQPQMIFLEYDVMSPAEQAACVQHFQAAGYTIKIQGSGGQNMLIYKQGTRPAQKRLMV